MAAKSAELEWRRQWKPDLKSSWWKTQKIGEDTFLIKSLFFDGGYEILISDLTNTWYEYLEDNDLQKRSKVLMNTTLENFVQEMTMAALHLHLQFAHM